MMTAYSAPFRPPIPEHSGHFKNDNYSGYFWYKRKAKTVTKQKDAALNKITKNDK